MSGILSLTLQLTNAVTGQEELREQAAYDESYPPQAQQQFSPISPPPNPQGGAEAGYAPGQYYPQSNSFPPPPGPGYTPQPAAYGHEQYPAPPGAQPQMSQEYGYPQQTGYTPPPPNAGQHPYTPPPDPYGQGGRTRRADENVSAAPVLPTPTPSRAAKRYMPVQAEGGSLPSPRPSQLAPLHYPRLRC